jgi:hypothetical protein
MTTLTWTSLPTSTPNIALSRGVFRTPVNFVSLEQSGTRWPYTAFLDALNPSGQLVGFCLEYGGQGFGMSQGSDYLASNCMTTVSPTTYGFSFHDSTANISPVIEGAYMPAGPIADVTFGGGAQSVPEPSAAALMWLGLAAVAAALVTRVR